MKQFSKNILTRLILLLALFILGRIVFFQIFVQGGFSTLLSSIKYGFALDVSVSSYITLLYLLFLTPYFIFKKKILFGVANLIYIVCLGIIASIIISNLIIYQYWGTLLNNRAIEFLSSPATASASFSATQLFLTILIFLVLSFSLVVALNKLNKKTLAANSKILWHYIYLLPMLFIGCRGGLQELPINESSAYFNTNIKVNHAAINPAWHLMNSIIKSKSKTNIPDPYSDQEVQEFTGLYFENKKVGHIQVLDTTKAINIIFILMESQSSGVSRITGGEPISTFLDSLAKSNITFSNAYSSGFRTDQGLASIFSGYPAQPHKSIIRSIEKSNHLPNLASEFKNRNYSTFFIYGGDLNFSNMNSYLLQGGFDHIIGEQEFPDEVKNSKWGAHDEFVFDRAIKEIDQLSLPFFAGILTLSNHEPYEVPYQSKYYSEKREDKFKNTASYADHCLRNFIEKAKMKEWYANTLFIISADHGHTLPQQSSFYESSTWHIPIVWAGDVLLEEKRKQNIHSIVNQHDMASTLLQQFNISSDQYLFSRNVLNHHYKSSAYMCLEDYIAWNDENGYFVLSIDKNETLAPWDKANLQSKKNAKLYLQYLMDDYNNR